MSSDLRVKANTWIERKRDQQPKNLQQLVSKNHQGPTPVEIGAAQWGQEEWEDHASQDSEDWGGYPDASHQSCRWHENQLSEEMSFVHQGGKSKGEGKGKDGGKGKGKDGGKSKGKDGGKGVGSYQGYCHWCGMWGHTANFCKQEDTYMEEQRRLLSQSATMRQLLSKSHGPLIAVNTLKKASQLLRIQLYILGANLEGSSWCACSNKIVSQQ